IMEVVHLTGDTVLGLGRNSSGLGRAFISTDKGQTFTTITDIGNNSSSFLSARAATAQIAIAGGIEAAGPTANQNNWWITEDAGATWAHTSRTGAPTAQIAMAGGIEAAGPTANQNNWWITEDAGATWAQASLTGARTTPTSTSGLTITRTGGIVADIDQGPNTGINAFSEIWRGTVSGFVSGGIGTCEAAEFPQPPEPPAPSAVMGVHLLCIPILTPQPCPPLCPTDPVQPEGLVVVPSAGFGGGFRSPLFLLGLADGTGLPAQPVAALGRPSGCGA